ncbi:hypothetical protein ABT160_37620 [Streptomyces sp. NPDC001941]|uniref:hypothetical protein n=1 Tax=Streptomyces sp. NPDC001941 TaxID=3154659 RepID=UPI00333377CC
MTADAIVCFDPALADELAFRTKRAGQLTSQMRFQTAQLDAHLADGLWLDDARRANAMTTRLGDGLKALPDSCPLAVPQATILFRRLPDRSSKGSSLRDTPSTTTAESLASSASSPPSPTPRRTSTHSLPHSTATPSEPHGRAVGAGAPRVALRTRQRRRG